MVKKIINTIKLLKLDDMKEARNFPIEPGEQFNYYEGDEWLMFTA
jgi:hypothetical protein